MACNVIKDNNGQVERVFADNGKPSILYNALVKELGNKEAAHTAWLKTRTRTFQNWFAGSNMVDENGEPKIYRRENNAKPVFISSPLVLEQEELIDLPDSRIKSALENIGSFKTHDVSKIINEINNRYKLKDPITGNPVNYHTGNLISAISKSIKENYPGIEVGVRENYLGKYIDVYSPDYIDPNNIYHQLENEDVRDADVELNEMLELMLDDLGIPVIMVDNLIDRDGNPMAGIAKADLMLKIIQVVKGKDDITTLPEEAAHIFVEILKTTNDPLYASMARMIKQNPIYEKVLDEYGEHPLYIGNEEKLVDEAIGKVIAKEIVNDYTEYGGNKKLADRVSRWFKRVWAKIKSYFQKNGNLTSPYRVAAQRMLRESVRKYRAVRMEATTTEEMLQLGKETSENTVNEQDRIVESILDGHNQLHKNAVEKQALPDSLRVIKEMQDGTEIERYQFIDKDTGETVDITNRVTDKGNVAFVRKVGLERAMEINSSERSAHLRKHGIRIHDAAQELLEYYASKSKYVDVVATHAKGIKSPDQIQRELGLNNTLMGVFKKGVQDILKQVAEVQKEKGEGRAKLLTEVKIWDKVNDVAGTIDAKVVYSDGVVDIYDWKTITPQWQYTERKKGGKLKIVENPFQAKMDTYNTQIGTYKQMLRDMHGVKSFGRSRIIPIHIDYKVKNWRQQDWRLTDEIETFEMAHTNSEFLQQISVAMEETGYESLDTLLKKLDNRLQKLQLQKRNIKGKKVDFAKLDARIKVLEESIQEIIVKGDIKSLITSAANRITQVSKGVGINDINHPNYLSDNDLRAIYEDFAIYRTIVEDSTDLLNNMIAKAVAKGPKEAKDARAYKRAFILTAGIISNNINKVQQAWLERIMDNAAKDGVELDEMPKTQGWFTLNFRSMDESPHPAFRAAHKKITRSFNKTKHITDTLNQNLTDLNAELTEWGKNKGLSLSQVFEQHFVEDINSEEDGRTIYRNLISKYSQDFRDEVKGKLDNRDSGWMKKNFKIKEGARKKFDKMRANMIAREEFMHPDPTETLKDGTIVKVPGSKNEKIRKANIKKWDQKYNVFDPIYNNAWVNPYWSMFLEPKSPETHFNEKFAFLNEAGNEPLLKYYNFYKETIMKLSEDSGIFLHANMIANMKDGMIDSILNTGLNMEGVKQFGDSMARSLRVYAEAESRGVYGDDGKLQAQIPIPFVRDLHNAAGNIDASLKSTELSQGLYLLANSIYNHKHMGEIESYMMGLREMIIHKGESVTNKGVLQYQGDKIRRQEASAELLDTYDKFVNFYLYGQKIQTEDIVIGGENGISMINTIKTLQSLYSAKVLGLAFIPGIAARLTGGINMYLQGVEGTQYTGVQLNAARKHFVQRNKAFGNFVEFFDPFQAGLTWKKARNLSMKGLGKIFDSNHLYSQLRIPDENMDSIITVAMAQNHGIDKDGILQRIEDLPKGSKSLWDSWYDSYEKGTPVVEGLTEAAYEDFRMRVKATAKIVKGEMSEENARAFDMTLQGQVLMQFKGWMPGIVTARLGRYTPDYHHVLKQLSEGYYWGFLKGEGVGSHGIEMVKQEHKLKNMAVGLSRRGVEAIQELIFLKSYTVNPVEIEKLKKEGKWSDKQNTDYLRRRKGIQMEYEMWKRNSTDPKAKEATLKDYLKMRQNSVRRTLSEIRILFALWAAAMAMGMGVGPDDEKFANQSWATRKMFMLLSRVRMELGFTMNPMEFNALVRGAVPLMGLFTDVIKAVTNGWTETLELLGVIAENKRDKTPMFYHTLKFLPGWSQMRRILEVYEQDRINPYKSRM